jgi:hypothetical protein
MQGKRANSFLGHTPRVPAAAASLVREMWRRQVGTSVLRDQGKTHEPKMKVPFWLAFIQPLEFQKKSLTELAEQWSGVRPVIDTIQTAGEGFKEGSEYDVIDTAGKVVGATARVLRVTPGGGVADVEIVSQGTGWKTHFAMCAIVASGRSMQTDKSSTQPTVSKGAACKFVVRCDFTDPAGAYLRWHYQSVAQSAVLDVLTMEAWRKGDAAATGSPHTEVSIPPFQFKRGSRALAF